MKDGTMAQWHNGPKDGPIVKIREVGRAACLTEYSPVHQEIFARAETTVNRHTCHFKTEHISDYGFTVKTNEFCFGDTTDKKSCAEMD